jgi:hypothetical protein
MDVVTRNFLVLVRASDNNQNLYKIMKMQMFATLDKAKSDTGNLRGLNLAAYKHTTVQVTRLPL